MGVFCGSVYALSVGVGSSVTGSAQVGSATLQAQGQIQTQVQTQAQMQASSSNNTSTNTSSLSAVAQVLGAAPTLIKTNDDLTAYDNLVTQARPAITAVNVNSDDSVAITYQQPAKLFGIFPTSLPGEVDVDAQGNASVHLPWYSVFYATDASSVQASVANAVQQSGVTLGASANANANANTNATAGTSANASGTMSGVEASTQLQNTARLINAITAALQAQAQVQASSSASTTGS